MRPVTRRPGADSLDGEGEREDEANEGLVHARDAAHPRVSANNGEQSHSQQGKAGERQRAGEQREDGGDLPNSTAEGCKADR